MSRRNTNYIVGLLLADVILTLLALHLATFVRLKLPFGVHLTEYWVNLRWGVYAMAALAWLIVSAALSVYTSQHSYLRYREILAIFESISLSNLTLAGLLYISYRSVPRLLFLYAVILQMSFMIGLRLALYAWQHLRYGGQNGKRILIIGAGRVGREVAQRIRVDGSELMLVGYLDDDPAKLGQIYVGAPVLGLTNQAPALIIEQSIEEVIFTLPLRAHRSLESLIIALQAMPVRVRVVPDFFDLALFRATIEDFGGIPLIGLRDPAIDEASRVVKRVFDLVVSTIGIVLFAPVMLLVAIAIRLDSRGPALFRQQRVGENGKLFTIYKFRSMTVDAEARQQEVLRTNGERVLHKRPDDPRITRVGYFIRRTSLDELPQLFNVMRGDMSLVGPRPELPWLVEQYESWQRKRLAVPPGVTGWWQINGRSEHPLHLNTDDDLYYIRNYSPWLDLRILWRTIGVVLKGKGAY